VTEAQVDTAVTRLFLGRMRLGMFDPPERVRWARTPISVLDQPSHRALALQVARESMVLLKNERGTLPLRKDLRSVAVIGPNADQWRMLLGNYNGIPSDPVTPLRGIRDELGGGRVRHAVGSDLADGVPVLATMPSTVLLAPDGRPGLRVEYFAGRAMTGAPRFTGADTTVEANWHEAAPRDGMDGDDFGVRWTADFRPPATGEYRLGLIGTLKARVVLDDSVVVRSAYPQRDDEFPDPRLSRSAPLRLEAGRAYRLRVEGQESYGDAQLQLVWSSPGEGLAEEAVRVARASDAVVLVLGLTANLEGEEMPVEVAGFRGGDRTRLDLPAPQQQLLERVAALGKPTVLVLLNGSALAVNWAQRSPSVGAIVEAWYPGQAGGTALADVLFGDYNPAGRLPVTFYRDTADLPPFADYAMKGRTYRFFTGTPLYPFGHGLSYTSFRYADLRASRDTVAAGDTVVVRVDVTNAGRLAGDEVVQLYVRYPGSRVERPVRELRGYRRVRVEPGATRTVELALPTASLAYWDAAADRWVHETQPIELEVGASSGDIRLRRTIRVLAPR
jgi:beta-glucosidase